jgi:hypothetical protein
MRHACQSLLSVELLYVLLTKDKPNSAISAASIGEGILRVKEKNRNKKR